MQYVTMWLHEWDTGGSIPCLAVFCISTFGRDFLTSTQFQPVSAQFAIVCWDYYVFFFIDLFHERYSLS